MPTMRRHALRVPILTLVTVLLAGVAGCSGKDGPAADLPAGGELVSGSVEAMGALRSAQFEIAASGSVAGVPLRKATGVITSSGEAEGSVQIDQSGPTAELSFVVKGQTLYVKAVTGGWQKVPLALASTVYDPSKILGPDGGVSQVLKAATGAKTQARESVAGVDTYRVAATFSGAAVSKLVPGIGADVPGQLWIGADRRLLYQGKFTVPAEGGGRTATITAKFSDFDAPVTINEP